MADLKHSEKIKRQHEAAHLSGPQIRAAKCIRSKARNQERKAERRKKAEDRNACWARLNTQQRLGILNQRLGKATGALRQRTKLLSQIKNKELAA